MKLKSLKKKLLRLEASLKKDSKKLAKLQKKIDMALQAEAAKPKSPVQNGTSDPSAAETCSLKKRNLTPEGRAKLAALMKARWDAKRASTATASETAPEHSVLPNNRSI